MRTKPIDKILIGENEMIKQFNAYLDLLRINSFREIASTLKLNTEIKSDLKNIMEQKIFLCIIYLG